jgi:hypothetical protein
MLTEPTFSIQMIQDKVGEILENYAQKPLSRSSVTIKSDRGVNVQRIESGGRVVTVEMLNRENMEQKNEVRRTIQHSNSTRT